VVRGLGAQLITLESNATTDDVPMPVSMALPIEVRIERVGVAQLDWRVGTNGGTIRGLAFGYAGGGTGHRLSAVTFVAPLGAVTGDATMGAVAPFPIAGHLKAKGDAALAGTEADIGLEGSLAGLVLDATGNARTARFTGRASLAPLAAAALREVAVDASGIDLAAWNGVLPATDLKIVLHASPANGGLAGTIEAANAAIGSIDAGRVPLAAVSTRFTWRDDMLALDSLAATLEGGGTIAGQGQIPLGAAGTAGSWTLELRNVDLRRIYSPLIETRLSGKVDVDLGSAEQRIRGDIADRTLRGGIGLDFGAVVANNSVIVERFRARSGKGELSGRGRIALDGERRFELEATASRFDPAAYAALPAGTLDGRIVAKGTLAPTWRVQADIALAPGSRMAGIALSGTARGTLTRDSIRDAAIDLAAGRARLTATGSAGFHGDGSDRITVMLDAPSLAELAPLFPASPGGGLEGALHAKAVLAGLPPRAGIEVDASGERLKMPDGVAIGSFDMRARIAAGTSVDLRRDLQTRKIEVDVTAKDVVTSGFTFATARIGVTGTAAQHAATLALTGEDLDVTASAHGGFDLPRDPGAEMTMAALSWKGSLDTLDNRGARTLKLAAPTAVEIARTRVRVGAARLNVADGNVHLAEFVWDAGKITTSGTFTAVPLVSIARITGTTLPFRSTLTLGGEWSLAAAPRLSGTLAVRREGGDLAFLPSATSDSTIAAGLASLEVLARFRDDALDATASLRSTRGDKADAKLAIGAVAGAPPGHIAPEAPLEFSVSGDIPSLQLLQPWIGTTAVVSGRLHVDIAARGTVARPALSGAVLGEGLRIDAPQYGVHYTNGRLAARAENDRIDIEDLTLGSGTGTFKATGEISGLAPGGPKPLAKLTWKAQQFRAFNRPNLHLVVGGEGSAVAQNGRITLSGKLRADEGSIVYLATPDSTLGDDVVVKGWARPTTDRMRVDDLPLIVDLTLELGDRLMFSGEGIETRLAGSVHVTSGPSGLNGKGSISTVHGTYFAFGQQLAIERGQLIFDGRLDNPGLDIVALRKNLAVEAGVTVTGTVKVPVIQLTSNPPVPDSEKLSWLVLGQGNTTSGGDLAALQAASAALLGAHGKPVSASIAQSIGLDTLTLKGSERPAPTGAPGAENQVIAVGKRLSDRLSLVYEQGLTIATNALRLEYELTRSLTLRAEAGTVGGLGIYFRRTFD